MKTKDRILEALRHEPMSVTQVTNEIGTVARSTVGDAIERLHRDGHIHIADWDRENHTAPMYRAGAGRDKKQPPRFTAAERTARYRQRHAAEVRVKRAAREGSQLGHYIQLLQK